MISDVNIKETTQVGTRNGYPYHQSNKLVNISCLVSLLFKPGACRPSVGVCQVSRNHFCVAKVCVYVCVCPSLRL